MVLKSQVLCTICRKRKANDSNFGLCNQCKSDPFKIELLRSVLAQKKDFKKLEQTYNKSLPEIKNSNSKNLWNEIFQDKSRLKNQDQMTKKKIKTVASFIQTHKKPKILDIGIGKGYLEEFLYDMDKKNIDLYGIDISTVAIDNSRKKYKGHFRICDALDIAKIYKKGFFDYIVALEVAEHISPKDILGFFHQVNSLLKPKGVFIITTPTNEHLEKTDLNPSSHVRQYTFEILEAELKLTGFKVSSLKFLYAFKEYYFIKNILRLIINKRWEANNITVKATRA